MNDVAIVLLLFVAAGLLVVIGVGLGRERGRQPSSHDTALMAAMTGIALGFLGLFLSASPMAIGPVAIGGVLVATWWRRGQTALVGAFLIGSGALVAGMQALTLINDLADPAVSIPGWTPVPLALGVVVALLGTALVVAGRRNPRTASPNR